MTGWIVRTCRQNKSFLLFVVLMCIFRSAVADWNDVPTGSMQPTIIEGDRIFVNKMAYDIRVPFTHLSLIHLADPSRGEIIVFDSKVSEKRLVKRVVGIPGDVVSLLDNELKINGEPLVYEDIDSTNLTVDKKEDLFGVGYLIRTHLSGSRMSNFNPVEVPQGYYLVLGDNRDNSADSRMIGLVPRDEIVGRTRSVVLSLDYENFLLPRKDRFFHAL